MADYAKVFGSYSENHPTLRPAIDDLTEKVRGISEPDVANHYDKNVLIGRLDEAVKAADAGDHKKAIEGWSTVANDFDRRHQYAMGVDLGGLTDKFEGEETIKAAVELGQAYVQAMSNLGSARSDVRELEKLVNKLTANKKRGK